MPAGRKSRDQFGKITVVYGENRSRTPSCTSLFIDDQAKVVIDPGSRHRSLERINRENRIDLVINSHWHIDHTWGNYLFPHSRIYLNQYESHYYGNLRALAENAGIPEVFGAGEIEAWIRRISNPDTPQSKYSPQNRPEWVWSTSRLNGTYQDGDTLDFGDTKMKVIHTPGHSPGLCCFHFPGEGFAYTGDIDLIPFGPFYGCTDSSLEDFTRSAPELKDLEVDFYLTGHQEGIVSKADFPVRLDRYLEVISQREAGIIKMLESGSLSLDQIAARGIIYPPKYHTDQWIYIWNRVSTWKHLERLITGGRVAENESGNFFLL